MKICVGYKLDGKTINEFPASVAALARCEPVYEELPGWKTPTTDIRSYDQLPAEARKYISRIEELAGCPVNLVCVGPGREQVIEKSPVL